LRLAAASLSSFLNSAAINVHDSLRERLSRTAIKAKVAKTIITIKTAPIQSVRFNIKAAKQQVAVAK